MNPRPPKLYGLIKIHKQNAPIRPVVSYVNSPTQKLGPKLNSVFKIVKFHPKHVVRNSVKLTRLLQKHKISENCFLVSFDVSNMFSNIPTEECKTLILDLLDKSHVNNLIKNELKLAFDLCLSQNYCQYNNKFYTQNTGLAMGAPLSPLLADIFMSYLEDNKILSSRLAKNHITFWYRYVDDVLACFTGTSRQLDNFLNFINSIHPTIKFTVETEKDNKINFLDLTLTREKHEITFNVYRKPTFTDTTISNDSLSPISHKLAAYNSMIHRAFSLPLSEQQLNTELNIIKIIALNNNFQEKTIDNLINKKQLKFAYNSIYPYIKDQDNTKYVSLTYYGNISERISNILSHHNLKVSFKPQYKLSQLLYNAKDITNSLKKSGVYRLSCSECNAFYIGQTGRTFEIRYKEHLRSFRLKKSDSTFSNHILESGHSFPELKNLDILHVQEKSFKLNLLESIEIFKSNQICNNYLLNDQLDLFQSTLFDIFK